MDSSLVKFYKIQPFFHRYLLELGPYLLSVKLLYHNTMIFYQIYISLGIALGLASPAANSCAPGWPPVLWCLANSLIIYLILLTLSDINC